MHVSLNIFFKPEFLYTLMMPSIGMGHLEL
jgi:hypothetical protein